LLLIRRNALRPPHPLGGVTKMLLLIRRNVTLRISGALHLCIFEQPVQYDFFWRKQIRYSDMSSPMAIVSTPVAVIRIVTITMRGRRVNNTESNGVPTVPTTAPEDTARQQEGRYEQDQQKKYSFFHSIIPFRSLYNYLDDLFWILFNPVSRFSNSETVYVTMGPRETLCPISFLQKIRTSVFRTLPS